MDSKFGLRPPFGDDLDTSIDSDGDYKMIEILQIDDGLYLANFLIIWIAKGKFLL